MRENNLLSPHRGRRRGGNGPMTVRSSPMLPNLMWGTDGVRVFTVDDGWGWIFTAIEHWNAECVGWHVCKRGDRFAALQPISMSLARLYDSTSAGAARGWPCGCRSRLPVSAGPLHQPDQVLGHPAACLRLRRRAPDQRRSPRGSIAARTDRPWPHLPQHRGGGTPSAASSNSTMPSGSSRRTAT